MSRYRFVDERKFRYFCEGLTLDSKDIAVLDAALVGIDEKISLSSRIVEWSGRHGYTSGYKPSGPQILVNIDKLAQQDRLQPASVVTVLKNSTVVNATPALHINLFSPVLQIPQRIELPLRLVLKGLPPIEPTHSVYLHALRMQAGSVFVYYGITKRGWMLRFSEHVKAALAEDSPLLFHRMLRESIHGRMSQLAADAHTEPVESSGGHVLHSTHHVICVAGVDADTANASEEYLVQKYSFGHPTGLNMIPGGRAGIAYLHQLRAIAETDDAPSEEARDRALTAYIRRNPRKGLPNPAAARNWEDPEYAARVICGPVGRLAQEQLREIRRLASLGAESEDIAAAVGASNIQQVERVLKGKTYTRVQ